VIKDIVAAYIAGATTSQLAEQNSICKSSVNGLLVDHAVVLRRQGLTSPEVEEAARLYNRGWPLAQVGEKFDRRPSVILRAFQKAGVPRRDSHGRPQASDPPCGFNCGGEAPRDTPGPE
jgi:hypothetical protein